jgi:hypothetical protein
MWQVNAKLRGLGRGEHELRLRTSRSGFSDPFLITSDPALEL